jgi:hypothetical protein
MKSNILRYTTPNHVYHFNSLYICRTYEGIVQYFRIGEYEIHFPIVCIGHIRDKENNGYICDYSFIRYTKEMQRHDFMPEDTILFDSSIVGCQRRVMGQTIYEQRFDRPRNIRIMVSAPFPHTTTSVPTSPSW